MAGGIDGRLSNGIQIEIAGHRAVRFVQGARLAQPLVQGSFGSKRLLPEIACQQTGQHQKAGTEEESCFEWLVLG